MDEKIKVFILCNNRLLRESIAHILTKRADLQVVGVQSIGQIAWNEIGRLDADVIVLDSLQFLIDDLHSARERESHPLKCVLVAMADDPTEFLTAVRHGALGYVLQEASASDVVSAIRVVAQGEAACPPRLTKVVFDFVALQTLDKPTYRVRARLGLTRREQQLVPLIGRGLTNKEIATELSLSEQTVKNHIHRILQKVGVEDRLQVVEACQTSVL